jgi:excisionase family DNA binding protein
VATEDRLPLLSVEEAAEKLGISPRTIRRWCESGRLAGQLVGTVWVVWDPTLDRMRLTPVRRIAPRVRGTTADVEDRSGGMQLRGKHPEEQGKSRYRTQEIRQRLREAGQRLIDTGNRVAGAQRRPGKLFLTWQSQRSLQVTFAIGRLSPLHGWTPHALGTTLPFWMAERGQWREVMPLLRRYETLRAWCAPQLLRIPGVGELVLAEIARFETAVAAIQEPEA